MGERIKTIQVLDLYQFLYVALYQSVVFGPCVERTQAAGWSGDKMTQHLERQRRPALSFGARWMV